MYIVRFDSASGKWVVSHPTYGTYPVRFTSEQMAQHQAAALNMAPSAVQHQS